MSNEIAQASKVLTHLGYAIRKDSLTAAEIQEIRKELTVAPRAAGKYVKGDSFSVFMESPTRFYLPRMWGQERFGAPAANILVDGCELRSDSLAFIGKPYDYQVMIVNQFIDAGSNGLICVPCGRGKTFMAINIAARLKKKFMIVVDKEFLLQQWSGELQSLMPGIRIGIIQENKKQIGSEIVAPRARTLPELKAMAKTVTKKAKAKVVQN
jgi:hypothetical protein